MVSARRSSFADIRSIRLAETFTAQTVTQRVVRQLPQLTEKTHKIKMIVSFNQFTVFNSDKNRTRHLQSITGTTFGTSENAEQRKPVVLLHAHRHIDLYIADKPEK